MVGEGVEGVVEGLMMSEVVTLKVVLSTKEVCVASVKVLLVLGRLVVTGRVDDGESVLEVPVLEESVLEEEALEDAVLGEAVLEDAVPVESVLEDVLLGEAELEDAVLEMSALEEAVLEMSALEEAVLEMPALEEAVLEMSALDDALLDTSVLEGTELERSVLDELDSCVDVPVYDRRVLTREDAGRVVVVLGVVDLWVLDFLLLLVDDISVSVLDGVSVVREAVLEGGGVAVEAQVQEVAFKLLDGTPLEGPVGVSTMVVPLGGL